VNRRAAELEKFITNDYERALMEAPWECLRVYRDSRREGCPSALARDEKGNWHMLWSAGQGAGLGFSQTTECDHAYPLTHFEYDGSHCWYCKNCGKPAIMKHPGREMEIQKPTDDEDLPF